MKRRFMCSEADYLEAHGIDLKLAVQYEQRYGPAQVRVLVEAGVSPEAANAIHGLHAREVVEQVNARAARPR